MRALSSRDLLQAWEQGAGLPPVERSLALLSAACPDASEPVGGWSIGRRDSYLLRLRESVFGRRLESLAVCPECGELNELTFSSSDLVGVEEERRAVSVSVDEWQFRLPTSFDLLAISEASDPARALLRRCLLNGGGVGELVDSLVECAAERMADADPGADIRFQVTCSYCGAGWSTVFDIGPFFWSELNLWAQRLLRDVHVLASAYGWSESDILNMSAWRRGLYLSLQGGHE